MKRISLFRSSRTTPPLCKFLPSFPTSWIVKEVGTPTAASCRPSPEAVCGTLKAEGL